MYSFVTSIQDKIAELDFTMLFLLNRDRLKAADRFFMLITDTAYFVAVLIPTILFILGIFKRRKDLKLIAYQIFLSLLLSTVITTILKYSIQRVRPFITYTNIEKLSAGGSPSFPSGHTADAFVLLSAVILLAGGKYKFIFPVMLWALAVAYSRIALGVHYPTDVIASMLIGAICAMTTDRIFKLKANRLNDSIGNESNN